MHTPITSTHGSHRASKRSGSGRRSAPQERSGSERAVVFRVPATGAHAYRREAAHRRALERSEGVPAPADAAAQLECRSARAVVRRRDGRDRARHPRRPGQPMKAAVMDCSALVELLTHDGLLAFEQNPELAECILVAPHLLDPEFLSAMRRSAQQHPEKARDREKVILAFYQL